MTAAPAIPVVYDGTGATVRLRPPGRSGGEGTVYEIEGRSRSVAKLYHPTRRTPQTAAKLRAMRASPPSDPMLASRRMRSIAWVEELLFADAARTQLAGFTMPRIDPAVYREAHAYFDPEDRIRRFGGAFTWRHLLGAATNIASVVAAIHDEGHRVGDLRETNVLIGPDALVAVIDCDSFQIRAEHETFYCRVGTADSLPPELQGASFRDDHDRELADRFALAVLVFKLLMEGTHPFQARGRRLDASPTTGEKIARGLYPYRFHPGIEPPSFAPPYPTVPPELRRLFERCFVHGHRRPSRRPTPAEWVEALRAAADAARTCARNPNHRYGGHLRRCPWCACSSDPFPAPGAARMRGPVPRPPRPVTLPRASRSPAAPPVAAPPVAAARRPWLRWFRWRRPGWRQLAAIAAAIAVTAAVWSPLGRSSRTAPLEVPAWSDRRSGACPHARDDAPDEDCIARWRLGPVAWSERHDRRFFVLSGTRRLIRVRFEVRFDGARSVPWIDARSLNASGASVCLAVCDDRIELRSDAGIHPLLEASGVATHAGSLAGGTDHAGAWTFDVTGARGALTLRYPGLRAGPIPIP